MLEGTDHQLNFFDGILSTFFKELADMYDYHEAITKTVFVSLVESFLITDRPVHPVSESLGLHPVTQNTLDDLWFSSEDSAPYSEGIFSLLVQASWKDVKHHNIIENNRFSTFQHSKLSPISWTARLKGLDGCQYLPLSRSLRKLLHLYMLGKCSKERAIVSDFFEDGCKPSRSDIGYFDIQKVKYAATILSSSTQDLLESFIDSSSEITNTVTAEEFLMKLNACLLWVKTDQSKEFDSSLPWHWLKEWGAAPV